MQDPQNKSIEQLTKTPIDKLFLEKIPLAGIARVADVSGLWLQKYVNAKILGCISTGDCVVAYTDFLAS